MKFLKYLVVALLTTMTFSPRANAQYANHAGVMLQGFYWDSYSDTKWTNLTSQADELSQYFNLIWIPNSAYSGGGQTMGYLPIYWFANYNSSFGNESQLRTMINTYKAKGVGFIADVVVNHRCGVSNWTNFPSETWNGVTYKLGPEHICCDDEVKYQSGQATPTGASDTGENYDGGRDLDHTSSTVQDNIKAYEKFLLEDLGYTGFRYDFCKGFGSQYIKIYNQYSQPSFSVGEYWDGSYDALKTWIEGTGRTSAAFDFAFKYAVNDAFSSGNYSKLVWMANSTTAQPAGLIHYGYPQYAVTFIDNHDTYRDSNKFSGDIVAANVFMLCSPGTPCIFLPHWQSYKAQLKPVIAARNAAGVTNTSSVTVLKSSSTIYMAEIVGTNGKVAVRIGKTSDVPSGYDSSKIVASGDNYCVWSTLGQTDNGGNGGSDNNGGNTGSGSSDLDLWLIGEATSWELNDSYKFTSNGNNKYTLSLSSLNGEFKIKDSDPDWKGINLGGDTGGEDVPTTPAVKGSQTLWQGSSVNLTADNFGEVTLTLTYDGGESATLVISDGSNGDNNGDDNNGGDNNGDNNGNNDNSGSDTTSGWNAYFDNSSTNWSSVYAYVWDAGNGNATITAAWPGDALSTVSVDGKTYYKYSYSGSLVSPKIIFNNGNGTQTADLDFVNNHVYTLSGMTDQVIGGSDDNGNTGGDNNGGNTGGSTSGWNAYYDNSSTNWSSVYAYVWDAGNGNATITAAWPGDALSTVSVNGATYYKYSYAGSLVSPKIIFNNGNGTQTADLDFVNNSVYTFSGVTDQVIDDDNNGDNNGGNTGGNTGDGTVYDLWLIGEASGWSLNDAYKFSSTGNNTYVLRLASLTGEFKIKDSDPDWKGVNLGGDTGGEDVPTTPAVEGDQTLWQGSSVNLVASDLTNCVLTLTFDGGESATLNIVNNAAGVQAVTIDSIDAQAEYYNLQGVKVDNPTPGLYIKRQGSTIAKVIIR